MERPGDDIPAPRPASQSLVTLAILTAPSQANPFGTIHGGVILHMADECGALAALRHIGRGVVNTVSMDSMTFLGPVSVGERVELEAEVTHVGRTSIETRIDVYAESMHDPLKRKVASGFAVYVALDAMGKPQTVPPLLSMTEADRRRDEAARERQTIRLARREDARARGEG